MRGRAWLLAIGAGLGLSLLGACGDDGAGGSGSPSDAGDPRDAAMANVRDASDARDADTHDAAPPEACAGLACEHGGRCALADDATTRCDCPPGFGGARCQHAPEGCEPNPCQHGGSCTMTAPGEYMCACVDGHSGEHCEQPPTTHCVLSYALDPGNGDDGDGYSGTNIRIRETALGLGDGTHAAQAGVLILRVPSDGGASPGPGVAELLYFHVPLAFASSSAGLTITTYTDAFSPSLDGTDNSEALATGRLAFGAAPSVTWDACSYPAGHDATLTSFTPDVAGTGAGCVTPYRSTGNVNCLDESAVASCASGSLSDGDNAQDETWEQALSPFTFSVGLESFQMPFAQIPNRNTSRTYVSWGGTLSSMRCE